MRAGMPHAGASAPGVSTFALQVPGTPEQCKRVRGWLGARLAGCGVTGGTVGDVVLVASELVSNAVLHSRSGRGGTVTVTAQVGTDHVVVAVADDGPVPPGSSRPRDRDGCERGRGLQVVAALADVVAAMPGEVRVLVAREREAVLR